MSPLSTPSSHCSPSSSTPSPHTPGPPVSVVVPVLVLVPAVVSEVPGPVLVPTLSLPMLVLEVGVVSVVGSVLVGVVVLRRGAA